MGPRAFLRPPGRTPRVTAQMLAIKRLCFTSPAG
jgi:hypothetical protein